MISYVVVAADHSEYSVLILAEPPPPTPAPAGPQHWDGGGVGGSLPSHKKTHKIERSGGGGGVT